ncbi:MAG: transketolase [Gammaproteobacteria bacterium]
MPERKDLSNAIRALSMDAVQEAACGHPGMPMGMADIAEVLWRSHLKHNPNNPNWPNRDRFVLSNGHGSMLIYSLLYLTGYDLSIDEIKNFRQLGSKTPGHPEYGVTPGIETTTGPLGQGIANAVGMALTEKILANRFNTEECKLVDHMTYVFTGDGCLMEGISHEACSLAGTLGLGKLIVIYDDNEISIDGNVRGWFTEDIPSRFKSYGWDVIPNVDGHNSEDIDRALVQAKSSQERPTIICCKTTIGKGSPNKEGTSGIHGSALGEEEIKLTRESLGWDYGPFEVPSEILEAWDCTKKGRKLEEEWISEKEKLNSSSLEEYDRVTSSLLPKELIKKIDTFIMECQENQEKIATRKSSEKVIEFLGPLLPELIGGSADLTGSNNTSWSGSKGITKEDASGNYIFYGVREFAMTAIMNGMCLHGGLRPYGGTFLTFLDYARNAVRMAALMELPNILVYSHDSISLGEDGPTHQPIEHLTSLRTTPGLETWRPCDTTETAVAWKMALTNLKKPTALILSRQGLDPVKREKEVLRNIEKGGYIIHEPNDDIQAVIISSGSEIGLSLRVAEEMSNIRVVSMPCTERFDEQDQEYKDFVLGINIPRIAVESSHKDWWAKYVGLDGEVLGMDSFGESAPGDILENHFGFNENSLKEKINKIIN